MTLFTPASTAPTRRPGPAVFFALVPLPINFVLNNVLAGTTDGEGISLALTILMVGATVVYFVLAASGIYV